MATNLIVRNVEENIALALKRLAAAHGRSAEAAHREILKFALQRPKRRSVAKILANMPNVGEDADVDEFLQEHDHASRTDGLAGRVPRHMEWQGAVYKVSACRADER